MGYMRLTYAYSVFVVALLGMAAIAVMYPGAGRTVYIGLALAALGVFLVAQPIALNDARREDMVKYQTNHIDHIKWSISQGMSQLKSTAPKPKACPLTKCSACEAKIKRKITFNFYGEEYDFCDHICAIDYGEYLILQANLAYIGCLMSAGMGRGV